MAIPNQNYDVYSQIHKLVQQNVNFKQQNSDLKQQLTISNVEINALVVRKTQYAE